MGSSRLAGSNWLLRLGKKIWWSVVGSTSEKTESVLASARSDLILVLKNESIKMFLVQPWGRQVLF